MCGQSPTIFFNLNQIQDEATSSNSSMVRDNSASKIFVTSDAEDSDTGSALDLGEVDGANESDGLGSE